mmetsp:Transcript_122043/g.356513  ORF Transcript_122043/g.356513 Transcript_122043/m.356513 type:complete len:111 (+) Transcript_122043:473-805(+)
MRSLYSTMVEADRDASQGQGWPSLHWLFGMYRHLSQSKGQCSSPYALPTAREAADRAGPSQASYQAERAQALEALPPPGAARAPRSTAMASWTLRRRCVEWTFDASAQAT